MKDSIAVTMPCRAWAAVVPGARALVRRAAMHALAAPGPKGEVRFAGRVELAFVLADDETVRDLNRRFRGKDEPTDVLSFPAQDATVLGDVVIAFETATGEAEAEGKSAADHLAHLVVHGVLHLRGWDHERAAEARRMEALEARILARLGIADPYRAAPRRMAG